jgi:uncharacterized iron-regulated membrane protein
MIRLSQDRSKSMLAIHGWCGVLLGLLLYAVIVTGMISVFADEIGDWSSPAEKHQSIAYPAGLDGKLRELAATVDPQYYEELSLFPRAGGTIQAFFHRHVPIEGEALPKEQGVEFKLHPQTLAVVDRREGFGEDIEKFNGANALADFLVELHVSLHIPDPWGYFVTGALGLAMMVAAVTGLFMHRHLLRDLFTIRRLRAALLMRRDTHVIAASWTLPFAFILAFTGSYFSFATSVGVPAMSMVAFGGDQAALYETIGGVSPQENKSLAAPANIDAMLQDARARTGAEPAYVAVSNYGRADSTMYVFTYPNEGELFNHNLIYDTATGAFQRQKPGLGLVPSVGGAAVDLMSPLHFGNFSGELSKSVWFALGFAGCYVVLSGLLLWTTRRAEVPVWQRMERAVLWMGFGLPLSLAVAPYGYFFARANDAAMVEGPMLVAFFAAVIIATAAAVTLRDSARLRRWLLVGCALALALLPIARMVAGGPGWTGAAERGLVTVIAIDVALIVGGYLCLRAAIQKPRAVAVSDERDDELKATA